LYDGLPQLGYSSHHVKSFIVNRGTSLHQDGVPAIRVRRVDAREFENARPQGAGDAVMEVMLQMRPNGRCLDHFRVALTGTVLETQVKATNVKTENKGTASRVMHKYE
jgi:hypothetical protein